jgi:hypothetical protein
MLHEHLRVAKVAAAPHRRDDAALLLARVRVRLRAARHADVAQHAVGVKDPALGLVEDEVLRLRRPEGKTKLSLVLDQPATYRYLNARQCAFGVPSLRVRA